MLSSHEESNHDIGSFTFIEVTTILIMLSRKSCKHVVLILEEDISIDRAVLNAKTHLDAFELSPPDNVNEEVTHSLLGYIPLPITLEGQTRE